MPGFAYACVATTPVPPVESPNSHVYDTIVPSGSNDADALNVTRAPGFTRDGEAVKTATGGCGPSGGGWGATSWEGGAVNEVVSVTFSVAVFGSRNAYWWGVIALLPVVQSP